MKKIIASLSGLTLSLTPVVGFMSSNYSENVSYLQSEENSTTVEQKENEKITANVDTTNSISQVDLQTLNELLKIVKEKQEIKNNNEKTGSSLSIMSKVSSFAINAKDILIKILKDTAFAAGSTALSSIKEELGKLFL